MEHKTYHHGDLKSSLIEAGISLINREGEAGLSLRKAAAMCGVSHAAPYAHFKNKEELLSAMKEHVTQEFVQALEDTIRKYPQNEELLTHIGKTYVMFFVRKPHYFSFLFSSMDVSVDLNAGADAAENYKPFALFQKTAASVFGRKGMPEGQIGDRVIAMWSLVHGLASIAIMKNVRFDGDWAEETENILKTLTGREDR